MEGDGNDLAIISGDDYFRPPKYERKGLLEECLIDIEVTSNMEENKTNQKAQYEPRSSSGGGIKTSPQDSRSVPICYLFF